MQITSLFHSFFMGGFECSTHRLRHGRRLDMITASRHDTYAALDYHRLRAHGLLTARDGLRWHLIEPRPGQYDFSSVLPQIRAARAAGVQVIWDLCHYGWPEDLDVFEPAFIRRFAAMVRAFVQVLASETDDIVPFFTPVNEISFLSWAGGDAGHLEPYVSGRSFELKSQLVRAAIEAIETVWQRYPQARMVHPDPMVHIVADPLRPHQNDEAEGYRRAQFQAWDMLSGRLSPLLGGHPRYLDIVGVNYYCNNQWVYEGSMLSLDDPRRRPLHRMLEEIYDRYHRPMLISETGIEGDDRPGWLRHIGQEARTALALGVPVHGVCLYPVMNHPGWLDERHCLNGLWDFDAARTVYTPLADELFAQQALMGDDTSILESASQCA